MKYVRYNFKSRYPQKIINSSLDEQGKKFILYTAECEYQLELRAKSKPKDKATIHHPTQVKLKTNFLYNLKKMILNSIKSVY